MGTGVNINGQKPSFFPASDASALIMRYPDSFKEEDGAKRKE